MKTRCENCPHYCMIEEGHLGRCHARKNVNGTIICDNYGKITSIALDPIEKKPLMRFYPGSMILSIGSYGCNLRCPFCQNSEISQAYEEDVAYTYISPEELVRRAHELEPQGNIGIAYTYNEPFISYEYVFDCAKLAHEEGLKNVLVTNGMVCEEPLRALLPYIDAMNIDLKGFTREFYDFAGGDFATVRRTIEISAKSCHVEVTTLVIPGKNDSPEEIEELAKWLAGIDPEIPYHLSRFFPDYKMSDAKATPIKTVYDLADVARKHLKYVYTGNC
ncbi:MAG: AmmeMemoRadiSam system radical SAM enzyme [Actinobacteria bacterium]|nr:AmmeMemoRadiSam system radical SAM enzyme [Actinomycetota bacterium]